MMKKNHKQDDEQQTKGEGRHKQPPCHIQNRKRKKMISWSMDDRHEIQLRRLEELRATGQVQEYVNKRRKINAERNFEAHNVKNDLANAGLKLKQRPRSLLLGGYSIDMNNVELIMSSKYSSLQDTSSKPDVTSSENCASWIDTIADYKWLINIAESYYKSSNELNRNKNRRIMRNTSKGNNSTKSRNSTREDDYSAETSTVLSPSPYCNIRELDEKLVCDFHLLSKNKDVTLHEALSLCDSARLIIESKSQKIVHSNASFSCLSGISSDQLVGSSLSTFVSKPLDYHMAIPSEEMNPLTDDENGALIVVQGLTKTITCKIIVFQVPWSLKLVDRARPQFSHFVLDFIKCTAPSSLIGIRPANFIDTNSNDGLVAPPTPPVAPTPAAPAPVAPTPVAPAPVVPARPVVIPARPVVPAPNRVSSSSTRKVKTKRMLFTLG